MFFTKEVKILDGQKYTSKVWKKHRLFGLRTQNKDVFHILIILKPYEKGMRKAQKKPEEFVTKNQQQNH